MKPHDFCRTTKLRLRLIGVAAAIAVAGSMIAIAAFNNREAARADAKASRPAKPDAAKSAGAGSPAPAANALAQGQDAKVEVERVTIFPYGFEPEEITRPVGPFLLAIDNRAGTGDFSLDLISDRRELVNSDSIRRGRSRTQKMLSLPPGKYVLKEAAHPTWACTITITPR